jgi:vacuolar-type H+-ATPase subunit E/Vma4
MSREILINDLRAKGAQQVESLWREARAEVDRLRLEAEARLAGESASCERAGREASQSLHRRRGMVARRRAGGIITRAEQELAERLHGLALSLLPTAWAGERGELLAELAAELPAGDWGVVRVHPEDGTLVTTLFPEAEIVIDDQVLGGLAVTSRDGSVTIDNTLNTRLARIWSRLVPELLRELR